MDSSRVEWFRRLVELWNSGEVEGFLNELGPDFMFTPDPSFPDVDTYRGEDLRRWLGEWARMWGESRLELLGTPTEIGSTLMVESRWHLTASSTGQAIPLRDFHFVVWFNGGRAVRAAAFFDRDQALAAAKTPPG